MSLTFSCFMTGTDTGVGKTLITAAMLNALGRQKLKAVGIKPVAAGTLIRNGAQWNEDVALLAEQSSGDIDPRLTTSYLLNAPCAPHVAAKLQDVMIVPSVLVSAYQQVAAQAEAVVVEGVGGFRVPLTDDFDTADFAVELGLDVILVVGLRLGCLNHALLTAEAIAAPGCLTGWVADQIDPEMPHQADNVQALQQRLSAPLLGVLPWMSVASPARAADVIDFSMLDAWPRALRD
jgi:dethiobiotin synthetase